MSKTPPPSKTNDPKDIPKWKQQHEEFIEIIKYNQKLKEMEEKGMDIR